MPSDMFISTKRYRKGKFYKEKQYASRYRALLKELLKITSKRDPRYIKMSPMCNKPQYRHCSKNTRVINRRKSKKELKSECKRMVRNKDWLI